jgi:arginine:ornithine antiporter / lysine permease
LKLVIKGESYNNTKSRMIDGVIATVATIYSGWVIISGTSDLKTFILGIVLLSSGIFFYGPLKKKRTADQERKELLSA